jgi:hypothetical protein
MKKKNIFIIGLGIILLIFVVPGIIFSQGSGTTGFTSPQKGDTLIRPDFNVSIDIGNFDNTTGHYWVAIASIKGKHQDGSWKRICELYKESRDNRSTARRRVNELISNWKLNKFWPKEYISKKSCEISVNDSGKNYSAKKKPPEPQPQVLLIIKVDDKFNNSILDWLDEGEEKDSWPAFPASRLSKNMILARCEIFFDE